MVAKSDVRKLTESLENEIFEKTVSLETDYAEIALDSLISNQILREIPIVKTLVAFYNVSSSLVAIHNVKKILVFLKELHSKNIKPAKLENFGTKFSRDPAYKKEVLETILVLNEKFIDVSKSLILANLFKAHIEDHITWAEFNHLAFTLNNLHPKGYDFLEKMSNQPHWSSSGGDWQGEAFMFGCGVGYRFGTKFAITEIGQKLYIHGLKPLEK